MVGRGHTPRSSLPVYWGEGRIYPFCLQMDKVELEKLSEKSRGVPRVALPTAEKLLLAGFVLRKTAPFTAGALRDPSWDIF